MAYPPYQLVYHFFHHSCYNSSQKTPANCGVEDAISVTVSVFFAGEEDVLGGGAASKKQFME